MIHNPILFTHTLHNDNGLFTEVKCDDFESFEGGVEMSNYEITVESNSKNVELRELPNYKIFDCCHMHKINDVGSKNVELGKLPNHKIFDCCHMHEINEVGLKLISISRTVYLYILKYYTKILLYLFLFLDTINNELCLM